MTQSNIVDKKAALGNLLQGLYENDQVTLIEAFLRDPQLSDFWNDTQNITLLQDNLRVAVQQVTDLQGQLQDQEQQFEASKADTANIAAYQQAQADEITSTKTQKNQLLTETEGQESKYQVLLNRRRRRRRRSGSAYSSFWAADSSRSRTRINMPKLHPTQRAWIRH